jgi:translation initiation factor 2B subunit (eIF-2B alpha/beta/delta family)
VRIPRESVTLNEYVAERISQQHKILLKLTDDLFILKRDLIDQEIKEKVMPELLKKLKEDLIKAKQDTNLSIENQVKVFQKILTYRSNRMNELESSKASIVNRLNEIYNETMKANTSLNNMLISASKLNEEQDNLFKMIKENIKLNTSEQSIDEYLLKELDKLKNKTDN